MTPQIFSWDLLTAQGVARVGRSRGADRGMVDRADEEGVFICVGTGETRRGFPASPPFARGVATPASAWLPSCFLIAQSQNSMNRICPPSFLRSAPQPDENKSMDKCTVRIRCSIKGACQTIMDTRRFPETRPRHPRPQSPFRSEKRSETSGQGGSIR